MKSVRNRQSKTPPPLVWTTITSLIASVERDGLKCAIYVGPVAGEWLCYALETPWPPRAGTAGTLDAIGEVFDAHAHQVIGKYLGPGDAFAAAESWAQSWMKRHRAARTAPCACDEIAVPS